MTDLRRALHEAATPRRPTPPPAFVVAADLARGRRALRRRRRTVVGVGSGLGAAAAAGLVAVVLQSGVAPAAVPAAPVAAPVPPVSVAPEATPQALPSVALVAYQGAQPEGYRLDKIPQGWEVELSGGGILLLRFVEDDDLPERFSREIRIYQREDDGVEFVDHEVVAEVPVGDLTGQVLRMVEGDHKDLQMEYGDGDAPILRILQPSGVLLEIQFPGWLDWSDQQLAEFAAAVQITEDAVLDEGSG